MFSFFVFVCVTGLAFVFLKGITSNGLGCLAMAGMFMFICCLGVMTPNSGSSSRSYYESSRPARSPAHSRLRDMGLSDDEIEYLKGSPNMRGYTDKEKEQVIESAVKLERALKARGKW